MMSRKNLFHLLHWNSTFHQPLRQHARVIGTKFLAPCDTSIPFSQHRFSSAFSPSELCSNTPACFQHCRHFITFSPSLNVLDSGITKSKLSSKSFLLQQKQWASTHSFLKSQSALMVKKSPRKKIFRIHDEGKTRQLNNVVAYAVGEEIRLEPLKTILMKQGLYSIGELPSDVNDALHIRGKYNVDQKPKEIFVFDDGSIVFWSVPEVERGAFLKLLVKYCESPYTTALVLSEREELDFTYDSGQTSVKDDTIHLKERDGEGDADNMLELYAFSNALAQSVKLSVWEASLEKFVSSIETVTEDVRLGKRISMSRRQVLKKSGELMSLRHLINLSSDLLDTPDFYWERNHLKPLYQSLCTQLEMTRRTKVINEKLTHCCELVDLISNHLSDEHHTRLEIMIIILIFVEVAFEVIHFTQDYLKSKKNSESAKKSENEESAASSED